jgi:hypothetical protein
MRPGTSVKRHKVKNRWTVTVYVPADVEKPLRRKARKEDRSHNSTIGEILREYFRKPAEGDYANPASQ